jgi:hypothetical protein
MCIVIRLRGMMWLDLIGVNYSYYCQTSFVINCISKAKSFGGDKFNLLASDII